MKCRSKCIFEMPCIHFISPPYYNSRYCWFRRNFISIGSNHLQKSSHEIEAKYLQDIDGNGIGASSWKRPLRKVSYMEWKASLNWNIKYSKTSYFCIKSSTYSSNNSKYNENMESIWHTLFSQYWLAIAPVTSINRANCDC